MEVTFKQWKCIAVFEKYHNGRTAIELLSTGESDDIFEGVPIATATTNIERIALGPGEVLIKDYSENEGMADALVTAKVIEFVLKVIHIGNFQAKCVIGRLTPAALQAAGLAR